jgi:uncharacterized protein YcbX
MSLRLDSISIFPLKSGAPVARSHAEVEPHGLAGDRRWMVVDPSGRFVTGRQTPALVLVRATPLEHALRLEASGQPALEVAIPGYGAPRQAVTVWDDTIDAVRATQADAWLTAVLGREVRLVHFDARAQRAVAAAYGAPGDVVAFADGFPLLLISQASLDGLNARLAAPVPMLRFRPNLVVSGCAPHAEDAWKRIRVGALELDVVKPCTRCVFTTVDPASGAFDALGEPLRTLKTYRRSPSGITFGQNLIARTRGSLRVGDPVEVLA